MEYPKGSVRKKADVMSLKCISFRICDRFPSEVVLAGEERQGKLKPSFLGW